MATIKQGLWYQCKKSHPYFTEGNYYYAPSDDTLNDNRNRPYLVMPCERSHFGKGEVIRIASPQRYPILHSSLIHQPSQPSKPPTA